MKGLNGFLVFLGTLFLVVIGGGLLGHYFALYDLTQIVFGYGRELWTGLAGAAMFILGLIVLFAKITLQRPEKSFSMQNPEGEVRIAFSAVEEMLKKVTSRIEGIEEIRPRVVDGKRGIEIVSRVSVSEEVNIPQLTMRIQEIIRSQIRDVIGLEELGSVRTYIYKIASRSKAKGKNAETGVAF